MLPDLQILERQGEIRYISRIFEYIIVAGKIEKREKFNQLIKKSFAEKTEEKVMTIAELFRQDGWEKGIEQGVKQGVKQGVEKGLLRGKMETSKEIAFKLLQQGVPLDQIIDSTGLSKEEIEDL